MSPGDIEYMREQGLTEEEFEEEIRRAERQRDWETGYYTQRDYGGRF